MKIAAAIPLVAALAIVDAAHVRVSIHSKQQQQAAGPAAKVWEQCSGENFKKDCEAPNKCIVFNKWYGQCQPANLDDGAVCAETGANNWKNDCKQGSTCVANGNKSYCQAGSGSTTTPAPVAPPAANAPAAKVWEPCGGKINNQEWKKDCTSDSTCIRFSEWYSQCQPVPAKDSPLPKVWEQCGGQGWSKQCADSSTTCVKDSEWYSQCRPSSQKQPDPATAVATWQACGGKIDNTAWTVPCAENNVCVFFNEYYSQCYPVPADDAPAPKTYEQCSGMGWIMACESEDDICVLENDWWGGCRPIDELDDDTVIVSLKKHGKKHDKKHTKKHTKKHAKKHE